jgi:hypothetical protein
MSGRFSLLVVGSNPTQVSMSKGIKFITYKPEYKSGFMVENGKVISIKYDNSTRYSKGFQFFFVKYHNKQIRVCKYEVADTKLLCIKKYIKTLKYNIEQNSRIIESEQTKLKENTKQLAAFQKYLKNAK